MSAETVAEQPKSKRINLRRPDIMAAVREQVEQHYRSQIVEKLRQHGGVLEAGGLKVRLAKEFGFCYGVERAIDLAYAARKVFPDQPIYILGEIIHNPEVNEQLMAMGIRFLSGPNKSADLEDLTEDDVVIIPAFGAQVSVMEKLRAKGCQLVDTTCGDVMSVWKRVTQNAKEQFTSIIHGKAKHEETLATSSRAVANNQGHYLVVLNIEETDYVCEYIRHGGNKAEFLARFAGAYSPGFDPDVHLVAIGVANQTTMLRSETEEIQRRLRQAMIDRYGASEIDRHFRMFDTICGATQERQDALIHLLQEPLDMMIVVGGYNSSNTSHLAEMSEARVPTYFIRNASKILSARSILHFNLHEQREVQTDNWLPDGPLYIGITAGASCPNNLIDDTVRRLFELRGVDVNALIASLDGGAAR
ncbi:MAG: 4-hydroxy-3-methylbut-2-enyl diphosphate reductase [Verrucomicrobiae bacterium]|nr:4-hydroxy-3-methylbut-2-enyl diphosphate reductase [Verrucomicrobiae bacterium]MDW8343111.1 4-hydroxy-3-methylbut-2-enyl diphosphate reductase [Verrucomicrobiae bacterium]